MLLLNYNLNIWKRSFDGRWLFQNFFYWLIECKRAYWATRYSHQISFLSLNLLSESEFMKFTKWYRCIYNLFKNVITLEARNIDFNQKVGKTQMFNKLHYISENCSLRCLNKTDHSNTHNSKMVISLIFNVASDTKV